jgi:hypothetical protein
LKTTPFAMFVFTLALVCQLLMPFTQSLAALVTDSQSIIFCTPLGLTTVSVNADTGGVGISITTIAYSFTALTTFLLKRSIFQPL